MCICAYIQAHTYVYTSVHVCALHIHMYVCMHMCVCVHTLFFKLTTQTTVRISILKKRKKNAMRRHKNPSMTSAWQWKPLARPGWMPLLQFLATHESTSTPREVWAEAARCLPTGAFTFNNSEVQLCRNVAKLFFPTIYTFSIYPIGRGRDGLKKRERERF